MKLITCLFLLLPVLFVGCSSTNPNAPMTHVAVRSAVTLGTQFLLEDNQEAVPYLRAATEVVCATASKTNVNAAQIVADLEAAGVTNRTTRLIITGSLAIFNTAVAGIGTNHTEVSLYAQDVCSGLRDGLPPVNAVARAMSAPLSPHLRIGK